ncbi:MAG: hypothetical protein ACYDBV_12425 [Nitrospiria bacterium]
MNQFKKFWKEQNKENSQILKAVKYEVYDKRSGQTIEICASMEEAEDLVMELKDDKGITAGIEEVNKSWIGKGNDDDIKWITVRGKKIPIKPGQSKGDAISENLKPGKKSPSDGGGRKEPKTAPKKKPSDSKKPSSDSKKPSSNSEKPTGSTKASSNGRLEVGGQNIYISAGQSYKEAIKEHFKQKLSDAKYREDDDKNIIADRIDVMSDLEDGNVKFSTNTDTSEPEEKPKEIDDMGPNQMVDEFHAETDPERKKKLNAAYKRLVGSDIRE